MAPKMNVQMNELSKLELSEFDALQSCRVTMRQLGNTRLGKFPRRTTDQRRQILASEFAQVPAC
jgi:hypothetical protein